MRRFATLCLLAIAGAASARVQPAAVPTFHAVAGWQKPLPNKWTIGQVSWVAIDSHDHVWILHRPKSVVVTPDAVAAPPVVEFDAQGAFVQAWGGPGDGYQWPLNEHALTVLEDGSVWISGSGVGDSQLLKFTSAGKFLMAIGRPGQKPDNADTTSVNRAASIWVNRTANEMFVADGEGGNRRVIVFDATTGAHKRHWGAYGREPDDAPPPAYDPAQTSRVFSTGVHCAYQANDGLVYVCDRGNDRIQVFRPDGTFVKEAIVAGETRGVGSACDLAFSPDQRFIYLVDGVNNKLWILNRESLAVVGSFGGLGAQPGQFNNVHSVATDSKGNIYTTEVGDGRRIQKFVPNQ